ARCTLRARRPRCAAPCLGPRRGCWLNRSAVDHRWCSSLGALPVGVALGGFPLALLTLLVHGGLVLGPDGRARLALRLVGTLVASGGADGAAWREFSRAHASSTSVVNRPTSLPCTRSASSWLSNVSAAARTLVQRWRPAALNRNRGSALRVMIFAMRPFNTTTALTSTPWRDSARRSARRALAPRGRGDLVERDAAPLGLLVGE